MSRTIVTLRALTPEERANALTHAFGVLLSLVGLAGLFAQLPLYPDPRQIVGAGIYGVSLVTLYIASTLCHVATAAASARVRRLALTLDYACIYLVIAGTYTPFSVMLLPSGPAKILLWIVWSGAILGVAFRVLWVGAPRWLYVPVYIALGWVAVVDMPEFLAGGGIAVFLLVLAGGALYTMGGVVYGLRKPNPSPRWFGFHEVFHAFTVAAFLAHYVGISIAVHA